MATIGAVDGNVPYREHWDESIRRKSPILIEKAWDAHLDNGDIIYYIEAKRMYSRPAGLNDAGCKDVSSFRSWFWKNRSGSVSAAGPRMTLTDCDMKETTFTTPMGLLELNGVSYVIVQSNGWESQDYGILQIEPPGITSVVMTPIR